MLSLCAHKHMPIVISNGVHIRFAFWDQHPGKLISSNLSVLNIPVHLLIAADWQTRMCSRHASWWCNSAAAVSCCGKKSCQCSFNIIYDSFVFWARWCAAVQLSNSLMSSEPGAYTVIVTYSCPDTITRYGSAELFEQNKLDGCNTSLVMERHPRSHTKGAVISARR